MVAAAAAHLAAEVVGINRMKSYRIPMIPGPARVNPIAHRALVSDFGASYGEPEFYELYETVGKKLARLMGTENEVLIQPGEGMAVLWGAVKSVLKPGETLLAVGTGVFGDGFADMASAANAKGELVSYEYDETLSDLSRVEDAIKKLKPKAITVVHCETPSGTLNPIHELGQLKKKYNVPLLIVDAVASIGAAPVDGDGWNADIVLGGTQKALSLPPSQCFASVSPTAWEIIRDVDYVGYEAFKPYENLAKTMAHPNTPDWNQVEALNDVLDDILEREGLEKVFARHNAVAEFVRTEVSAAGYRLFPKAGAISSPSVSAIYVPEGRTFDEFNAAVRAEGMGIAGSFGKLDGKIFRLGHMGTQATFENATAALDVLKKVI